MKRVILDIAGFNWIKRVVFAQGAVIRVLTNDDVARVGDIVELKKSGAPDEESVILEVTLPVTPAPAAVDTADDDDDTPASAEEAAPAEKADTTPRRRRNPFM